MENSRRVWDGRGLKSHPVQPSWKEQGKRWSLPEKRVQNNYCLLFKSHFPWEGDSWTLLEKAPATVWAPGFLLGSPPHLLYNPLAIIPSVLSCPALQLWTVKVPRFTADSEDGNTQEINSEPPDINRHLQSHGDSRASPAAAGTALLTSHSPALNGPQKGRSSLVTSGIITSLGGKKFAFHSYLSIGYFLSFKPVSVTAGVLGRQQSNLNPTWWTCANE